MTVGPKLVARCSAPGILEAFVEHLKTPISATLDGGSGCTPPSRWYTRTSSVPFVPMP